MMKLPRTPSFRLDGRHALVTGASSGIGLACAAALAGYGATVTLCARRRKELEAAVDAINAAGGAAASAQPLDITNIEETARMVGTCGPFDILVNAAGMARHGPAATADPADYDAVMAINTRAAFFLARQVASGLAAQGRKGSIITISSQMGHIGGQERAVYCASKHAVEGFNRAMAIEWGGRDIRFNTICPTFILTDLTRETFKSQEKRAWIESRIKLGRVGQVEDVMGAVVYLASDASSLVTGASLMVDGGWTAG